MEANFSLLDVKSILEANDKRINGVEYHYQGRNVINILLFLDSHDPCCSGIIIFEQRWSEYLTVAKFEDIRSTNTKET